MRYINIRIAIDIASQKIPQNIGEKTYESTAFYRRIRKRGYLNTDFRIFHLKDTLKNEFEFHYHEFHKITIFLKGNVRYFVEGKSYELEPYDIVLVNRNDIHRVETDPSVPYKESSSTSPHALWKHIRQKIMT